jgi:hypothetical protein
VHIIARAAAVATFWIAGAASASVTLGGCAAQEHARAQAQLDAYKAACDSQWPRVVGNYSAHAQCVNDGLTLVGPRLGMHPDLLDILKAARLSLSAKVDRREIPPEDAELKFAQLKSELTSEQHRRDADRAARAAALLGAAGAVIQSASQPHYYSVPYAMPPPPRSNFNCTSMALGGGMTTTNCY